MSIVLDGTSGLTSPAAVLTTTPLAVTSGGTGVTTSTGTGAVVLGTSPSISGAVMTTMASSVITSGTAVASTSGTSIDFTGIPSWVKRITVMFNGVSTSGTSITIIQLGSGSPVTSGYVGQASFTATAGYDSLIYGGTGFPKSASANVAANTSSGVFIFVLLGSNIWQGNGTFANNIGAAAGLLNTSNSIGTVTLSGVLDRVRITNVNGTDTFDAGSVNILYE